MKFGNKVKKLPYLQYFLAIRECDRMNYYEKHQKLNIIYRKKHLKPINPTYYENLIRMKKMKKY